MFNKDKLNIELDEALSTMHSVMTSEIAFYVSEYPEHNNDTPTAAMVLESLARTLLDLLEDDSPGSLSDDMRRRVEKKYRTLRGTNANVSSLP